MGYKKPLEIKLQLTEECNFDCGFCFNKQSLPQNSSTKNIIPTNDAKKVIQAISSEGIQGIRFTGGEPLLHPSLPKLLTQAKQLNLKTTLNTNASLLNKANAKAISQNADTILVSFQSLPLNKSTQKPFTLLSKGNPELNAATILTKENIQSLEQFHAAFLDLPFSQWVLLRQIPNALNKNPASQEDMQLAIKKLAQFNSTRPKKERFLIENALPFCCSNPEQVQEVALGAIHEDGHSSLFVDTNLRIKPSYFLDVPLGNALQDSLLKAWNSPFMKRMNALEFIPEACHKCDYVLKCMAGSRFSALFTSNSLYAFDPLANPSKFLPELERNQ
jgi:MoaA/NifB/PqqE/SkfB family radical SAM enzyme